MCPLDNEFIIRLGEPETAFFWGLASLESLLMRADDTAVGVATVGSILLFLLLVHPRGSMKKERTQKGAGNEFCELCYSDLSQGRYTTTQLS